MKKSQLRLEIKNMLREHATTLNGKITLKEIGEMEGEEGEFGEKGEADYEEQQSLQEPDIESEIDETIASILDNALTDIYDLGYDLDDRELLDTFQKLLVFKNHE